ncbi:hypothetical protein JCM6882_005166 [Rhodosporidiobolus microsporus]
MATVQLKITHGTTLRKVPYSRALPSSPYASLLLLIKERFNLVSTAQVELLAKDEDGDWVTVSSDTELEELFASLEPDEKSLRMQLRTVEPKPAANELGGAFPHSLPPAMFTRGDPPTISAFNLFSTGASEMSGAGDSLSPLDQARYPISATSTADKDDSVETPSTIATAALRASVLRETEFPSLLSSSPPPGEGLLDDLVGTSQPIGTLAGLSSLSASLPSLLSNLKTSTETVSSHLSALLTPPASSPHPNIARVPTLISSLSSLIPASFSLADLPELSETISALCLDVSAAVQELAWRAEQTSEAVERELAAFQATVEKAKEKWVKEVVDAAVAQARAEVDGRAQSASSPFAGEVLPAIPIGPAAKTSSSTSPSSSLAAATLAGIPLSSSAASAASLEALAAHQQQQEEVAEREPNVAARAAKEERKRAKEQKRREKAQRREERAGRRTAREQRRKRRDEGAQEKKDASKEEEKSGEEGIEEMSGGVEGAEAGVEEEQVEGGAVQKAHNGASAVAQPSPPSGPTTLPPLSAASTSVMSYFSRLHSLSDKLYVLLYPSPDDDFDSSSETLADLVNLETVGGREALLLLLAVRLVDKTAAASDAAVPQTAARFARLVMERASPDIVDSKLRTHDGTAVSGGALWRSYVLNYTQTLHLHDDRKPGLLRFVGHLFLCSMLPEASTLEPVQKFLTELSETDKSEETVSALCALLHVVGKKMDLPDSGVKQQMDVYFSRIEGIAGDTNLSADCRKELTALIARRAAGWPPLTADSTTPNAPSSSKPASPPSTSPHVAASTFLHTLFASSRGPSAAAAAAAFPDQALPATAAPDPVPWARLLQVADEDLHLDVLNRSVRRDLEKIWVQADKRDLRLMTKRAKEVFRV